jgi:hypothetical protein
MVHLNLSLSVISSYSELTVPAPLSAVSLPCPGYIMGTGLPTDATYHHTLPRHDEQSIRAVQHPNTAHLPTLCLVVRANVD